MGSPYCRDCGERLRPDARFCDRCGHAVKGAGPAASVRDGELYRSAHLLAGQQRLIIALLLGAIGLMMFIMGLSMPVLVDPWTGVPDTTFRTVPMLMGAVLIAVALAIYFLGRREAGRH